MLEGRRTALAKAGIRDSYLLRYHVLAKHRVGRVSASNSSTTSSVGN